MKRKHNGIILIGGFGQDGTGRKVFDLKVTNTFPIISINTQEPQFFVNADGEITEFSIRNQHISIPPDLNIHLTPSYHFLHKDIINESGLVKNDFVYLFGWFSKPIDLFKNFTGTYDQAMLFFLTPDKNFNSQTGLFVELFAHNQHNEVDRIMAEPTADETVRYISNHEQYPVTTIKFSELIRAENPKITPQFYLSLRYGFWEPPDNKSYILLKAQK